MFTEIDTAIEEALWSRYHFTDQKRHFKVVQQPGGLMAVQQDRGKPDNRIMWSTRNFSE